jgi:glycosyltransferase involved in cell wall biosynthesis
LQELEKKYTIQYLFPEHKRDYHHWQVKGRIIWVEWAHKFAKEVAKKKWGEKKIFVRLHRYEIETPYMDEIKWDNVDKLIFVNPELEGLFMNRVKKQVDTITIPNAIDISKFHYNAPTEENSLLAFSMRYNPAKSYDQLIETFAKIAKINPHIKLTIAAQNSEIVEDNDHYKKCKQLVKKYRLWKNINLYTIKNDSEIFELLKTHNTIVSYSQLESFHYSFAEGLLSGLEGFCNGWRDLNPRFFWNDWCYDNEQDFINAILKWSKSPLEDRIYKSKKNREYIINNYSSSLISNAFENIYNSSE